jgi:hypothetical protein
VVLAWLAEKTVELSSRNRDNEELGKLAVLMFLSLHLFDC